MQGDDVKPRPSDEADGEAGAGGPVADRTGAVAQSGDGNIQVANTGVVGRDLTVIGNLNVVVPAERTEGDQSVRTAERAGAVARYRQAHAVKIDTLPLHGLGAGSPSMHLPGLGKGIKVRPGDDATGRPRRASQGAGTSKELLMITRREGRLLLVGQPGAGKSVALEQIAAHFASIPHAPVPLFVSLKQVAEQFPRQRTASLQMRELIDLAARGADDALRAALEERIKAGDAILLLDGLDETQAARDRVIDELRRVLDAAHPDLDVVVSSRHAAAEAAAILGLARYVLEAPGSFDGTIDALLDHLAPSLAASEKQRWLSVRRDHIRRSQHDEPAVWSVPLLATLAAVLLAERNPDQMPTTRAGLLHEVVRESVHRWAAHREDVTLPGQDKQISSGILIDTFADIASVVAAGGAWQQTKHAVIDRLQQHWNMAPGSADTVAERVIEHWDATAGVFVTSTARGPLSARTRLFTEIGDALYHIRPDAGTSAWVEQAASNAERWETLRLAAGLSPHAASDLVRVSVEHDGDLLDVACDAWADGAELADRDRAALVAAQLSRLSQASMDVPPEDTGGTENDRVKAFVIGGRVSSFARLAVRIAQLRLTDAQVTELAARCERLPDRQRDVVSAIAAANRATLEVDAPDSDTLDLLEKALPTDAELDAFDDRSRRRSDQPHGYDALVEAALGVLVPFRPHCARRIARTAYLTSVRTFERANRELRSKGLGDALTGILQRRLLRWTTALERFGKDAGEPFATLRTSLTAPPASLTPGQLWHLDEAAALFDRMHLAAQAANAPADAVRRFKSQTLALTSAVIQAAELSPSVIAAQIDQVHTERPETPEWGLLLQTSSRLRISGLDVRPEHLTVALDALNTGNAWLARVALDLYLEAGALSDTHAQALLTGIRSMPAWSRHHAAFVLTELRPDLDLPLDDPAVRAGHAAASAHLYARDGRAGDVIRFLSDPDLTIRDHAAHQIRDVDKNDYSRFQAALNQPATQWTCLQCDATRSIDEDACPDVRHARPEPNLDD